MYREYLTVNLNYFHIFVFCTVKIYIQYKCIHIHTLIEFWNYSYKMVIRHWALFCVNTICWGEVWEHWCTGLCSAVPSGKTKSVPWRALEQGGANVHFQSPHQNAVLDPVWDPEMALGVKIQSGCLWLAQPTEGIEVYFQSFFKMWFPWDFPSRNIMSEETRDIYFQLDIQYFFFKCKWKKINFLYNPLLLKLKSLKAAVYLLHCTKVIEGSQVSFQAGEQQKLVLYKQQAATNHLLFTPFLWMGLCSIWRAEHNPSSLLASQLPRNLLLLQQWRGGIH